VAQSNPVTTSQWWAFRKPERPAVPSGAPNPIDAFINRKLQTAAIAPSPEADRLTLLRRASYDLLGLPPSQRADRRIPGRSLAWRVGNGGRSSAGVAALRRKVGREYHRWQLYHLFIDSAGRSIEENIKVLCDLLTAD